MTELIVKVENLKSINGLSGIKKAMLALPGVKAAYVSEKLETITVKGYELSKEAVLSTLAAMGCPEKMMTYS